MQANFKPYEHQKSCWNAMDKEFIEQGKNRGMIIVPTGGGKTTIATRWSINNFLKEGYRILWLAHRVELLEQAYYSFLDFSYLVEDLNDNSMIKISSKYFKWENVREDHQVVFSTDKSAALNLSYIQLMAEQSDKGVLIIIDEAHHSVANGYQKIIKILFEFNKTKEIKLIGLTATPVRLNPDETEVLWRIYDDNYQLNENLKPINKNKDYQSNVYNVSQEKLIDKDILAEPITSTVNTEINFEKEFTEEDYQYLEQFGKLGKRVLKRLTNSAHRNKKIVEHYKENKNKFGKTLVFAVDIAHAKTLKKEFEKAGLDAEYVASTKSSHENEEIIEGYKNNNSPQVLINIQKLTEGFDAPETQTVFITRPTKSESLLRQMIGRGIRGVKAGGTQKAYLVTFVDTWHMFKPIATDYIVNKDKGEIDIPSVENDSDKELIPISDELVMAAYDILQSKVAVHITGIHQALPEYWFQWTGLETSEESYIVVFDNQIKAYEKLIDYYQDNKEKIPDLITKVEAEKIMYDFFGDCKDPLPSISDIIQLLAAIRREIKINKFKFTEKNKFSPTKLAKELIKENANISEIQIKLRKVFQNNKTCKKVYKDDFDAFYKEVNDEIFKLNTTSKPLPRSGTAVKKELSNWKGQGYDLEEIVESVTYREDGSLRKKHFPNGIPPEYKISYTSKVIKTYFGICRYRDKTIKINKILNSPDIPLYLMEFLVYHELLHSDMPNNDHDNSFRSREKKFRPSKKAVEDFENRGNSHSEYVNDYWWVVANQFLGTLGDVYDIEADK